MRHDGYALVGTDGKVYPDTMADCPESVLFRAWQLSIGSRVASRVGFEKALARKGYTVQPVRLVVCEEGK